jgi:hypothetical protein
LAAAVPEDAALEADDALVATAPAEFFALPVAGAEACAHPPTSSAAAHTAPSVTSIRP